VRNISQTVVYMTVVFLTILFKNNGLYFLKVLNLTFQDPYM